MQLQRAKSEAEIEYKPPSRLKPLPAKQQDHSTDQLGSEAASWP